MATTSEADEDAVTLAPGRGSALSTTAVDPDEETTTSAARARTTAVRTTARSSTVEETTSTTEEETSTTPSSTTTRTTATPTSTRTTAARTPLTTTPTTTSASRTTSAISSSASSGIGDSTSSDNANSDASSGGKSNGGTIAGVIIAVLAVLAIAAFFAWRFWKKKKAAKNAGGDIGDTFYPYGGVGGGTKNNNVGSGNGYNQQIDSYEDLASVANPNGEKNNGGYGTIGNEHNNEKYAVAAGGLGAGMPGMNRQLSAEQENFAGRGLSPYNSFNSFPSQTMTSLISPTSPPMNGNNQAFGNNGGNDSYPPTPQQYSQQGSIFAPSAYGSPSMGAGGAPNAAMMNHQSMASDGGFGGGDHLPHHQDRALSSAMDAYNGNSNGNVAALGAAAAAAAVGAGAISSPFADPASEGKTYIVTRTFEPSMPDELLIYPGDRVQIVVPYDDGWCLGVNLSSSQRDNAIPQQQQAVHKGVFPQDCVEEWSQELEDMMLGQAVAGAGAGGNGALATVAEGAEDEQQQQQEMLSPGANYGHNGQLRPTSVNSNMPLAENANLQRAPTLPPLDMGDNSRFSMTSGGGNNNNNKRISHISNTSGRPTSLIPGYSAAGIPLPASIKSPMSGNASLAASRKDDDDNESLDPYGGVAAAGDLTSPTTRGFAPDIQVHQNNDNDDNDDNEERRKEFGSSYHIADYASRIGSGENSTEDTVPSLPAHAQQQRRTSTALSERRGEEDFPSTPRTMSISAAPSSSSPRFSGVPTLSSADNNAIPRSPAAPNNNNSNSRLSVAPSLAPSGNSRLSVSAKSLKRTSSLVAPQDAETFIANGTPEMMPLPLSATSAQFDFNRRSANLS